MKAIIKYPLVIIQEQEIELTPEEAAKLPGMSTFDKAKLIFEYVETFPSYEKVTGLSLIDDALSVGAAGIYVGERHVLRLNQHA